MNSETGYDQFRARLAQLIGDEAPTIWAKRMGISAATFDRMWNQRTIPKSETLAKIVDGTAASLDWLLLGKSGAMQPVSRQPSRAPTATVDGNAFGLGYVPCVESAVSPAGVSAFALADDPERIYVRLPLYLPRPSAGQGLAVREEALAAHLLFSADWLWQTLRRPPEVLICLQAHGDSMEPRIRHGDVLIVDTGVDRIKDNGIYCFSYEGDLMVKRLYRDLKSRALRIVSDNTNYPPQELAAGEANRINVVGLVVWHGGLARA